MLKQNWIESRDRFAAFWKGQPLDRSPVLIDSVGPLRNPMYRGSGYDYTKYGEDIDRFGDDYLRVWEARAGLPDDAIPAICPQMGGAIEAAFFAGEINWGTEVTSLIPHNPLEALTSVRDLTFNPANPYYRRVLREVRYLSERGAKAGFGVNVEASMSITTTISQLRGGTRFMYDIMDDPAGVRLFAERICDHLLSLTCEVDALVPHPDSGTCHRWLNYWNPGSGFWFSEDDAMMLSPSLFRDLFLDLDRRLCQAADCVTVHWHTGALHLIPELLRIPELRLIQLSPDPSGPSWEKVLEACRAIEAAGKRICFQIGFDESQLKRIFRVVRPSSCMFYFGGATDAAEVERIVGAIARLGRSVSGK